jgi:hypothetical protein
MRAPLSLFVRRQAPDFYAAKLDHKPPAFRAGNSLPGTCKHNRLIVVAAFMRVESHPAHRKFTVALRTARVSGFHAF